MVKHHVRGGSNLNLQKSSCVKTEHLLRMQSILNERSIQKEGKMCSIGFLNLLQIFYKWGFKRGTSAYPSQVFQRHAPEPPKNIFRFFSGFKSSKNSEMFILVASCTYSSFIWHFWQWLLQNSQKWGNFWGLKKHTFLKNVWCFYVCWLKNSFNIWF